MKMANTWRKVMEERSSSFLKVQQHNVNIFNNIYRKACLKKVSTAKYSLNIYSIVGYTGFPLIILLFMKCFILLAGQYRAT